jgi:hypothetical protein
MNTFDCSVIKDTYDEKIQKALDLLHNNPTKFHNTVIKALDTSKADNRFYKMLNFICNKYEKYKTKTDIIKKLDIATKNIAMYMSMNIYGADDEGNHKEGDLDRKYTEGLQTFIDDVEEQIDDQANSNNHDTNNDNALNDDDESFHTAQKTSESDSQRDDDNLCSEHK